MTQTNIEHLRKEYDYVLNYITLTGANGKEYDISGHWSRLSFEESVASGFIHCSLFMVDSVDYPSLIPIVGGETIKISFTRQKEISRSPTAAAEGLASTPAKEVELLEPIEFEGIVYTIEGRELQSDSQKMQVYTLKFISKEYFENLSRKVRKSWKKVIGTDVVQNIFDEYIKSSKPIEIEASDFIIDYVASNKYPYTIIVELTRRLTSSKKKNSGSYYFFEDRDQFNFVTLDSLFEQPVSKTIRYDINNVTESDPNSISHKDREIEKDINRAEQYSHVKTFDVIETMTSGEHASRLLSVDPLRRKFFIDDFDLESKWDSFNHLDTSKPYLPNQNKALGKPEANVSMLFSKIDHEEQEHIISKDPDATSLHLEKSFQHRNSQLKQIERSTIHIVMPGDPRVKAGQVIEFSLPQVMGKVDEKNKEELDPYLKGKYLIFSIAHILDNDQYYMNIELMKDGFATDIEPKDPLGIYIDTY